jgi:hypothetical protein
MKVLKSPLALLTIAIIGGTFLASTSEIVNPGYGYFQGIEPILLGSEVYILMIAYINAGIDARIIQGGQNVNHWKRFIIRAAMAAGFSLLAFGFTYDALWLTIFQGASFWIAFDIFLAKKRGRVWNYISTWHGTSKLDLLFKGHWIPQMTVKVALMLGAFVMLYFF